jgi:hypothetical protein
MALNFDPREAIRRSAAIKLDCLSAAHHLLAHVRYAAHLGLKSDIAQVRDGPPTDVSS